MCAAPSGTRRTAPSGPLILALVLGGLVGDTAGSWAGGNRSAVSHEVHARIHREGRARVIVELRLPTGGHTAEGQLPGATVAAQRSDIAATQAAVMRRLGRTAHRVVHRHATVPFLTVEVGPDAVRELEAAVLDVGRVIEDVPHPPALPTSVPLVEGSEAWDHGYDGTGVTVAILDTGVDSNHPFLAGKVVEEACYSSAVAGRSVSVCPNGAQQIGPGAGITCAASGCWHGTHVAGIAAGSGGGAGEPFSGVARGADIMAIQVFSQFVTAADCGGQASCLLAWTSDIIAALERVYIRRGAYAIAAANLSLGGSARTGACDSDPIKPAIDNLRSVGIATVIAAGNGGSPTGLSAPACISSAISVGSTTKSGVVSSFTNASPLLSLFAPGSAILSSVPSGGFATASGTSMATPHVTGAWAVLKQVAPAATVDDVLAALQQTGAPIADTRSGATVTRSRIRIAAALAALVTVRRPVVSGVTPSRGTVDTALSLTVSGANFRTGATVGLGADVAVTRVAVGTETSLIASVRIAGAAAPGPRDVTITNPDGGTATLVAGFTVASRPPGLSLAYAGKLRDRVGRGDTALAGDGILDGTFAAALAPGSGDRTVVRLKLRSSSGGTWDTRPESIFWALGAAATLDGALVNDAAGAVSYPVADGATFSLFAADVDGPSLFVPGTTFTLTAAFADGTKASATATVTASPPAQLGLAYSGLLRDRVGRGNRALGADGSLDGTFTVTLAPGSGDRTVVALELRGSSSGTWDTRPESIVWALGAAATLDGALVNDASGTLSHPVADGGSFVLFAADFAAPSLFAPGTAFTLTATFADGTTAGATTTVSARSATHLTLEYVGALRDRVGGGNAAADPDAAPDGTFAVTVLPGSGNRTVVGLELRSSSGGTWDTRAESIFWTLGVAAGLDGALISDAGPVSFDVDDGATFVLFAADFAVPSLFAPDTTFTLTAIFADGGAATAATTLVPATGADRASRASRAPSLSSRP